MASERCTVYFQHSIVLQMRQMKVKAKVQPAGQHSSAVGEGWLCPAVGSTGAATVKQAKLGPGYRGVGMGKFSCELSWPRTEQCLYTTEAVM